MEDPRASQILKFCKTAPKTKTEITSELFRGHVRAPELNDLLDGLVRKGKLIVIADDN